MTENTELRKVVKLALIRVGIKCDLVGFNYLVRAVEIVIEDPPLIYSMPKVFKKIAKEEQLVNPFRVEANIHNAISLTYRKKGLDGMNNLYEMPLFKKDYKPSTAEIVRLVAEYCSLELYKTEPKFGDTPV